MFWFGYCIHSSQCRLGRSCVTVAMFFAFVTISAVGLSQDRANPVRTWTSADGKYTVSAVFMALDGRDVVLKRVQSSYITVPLDSFSRADQLWLSNEGRQYAVTPRSEEEEAQRLRGPAMPLRSVDVPTIPFANYNESHPRGLVTTIPSRGRLHWRMERLLPSPKGERVAYLNHQNELVCVDLKSGALASTKLESYSDTPTVLVFSLDENELYVGRTEGAIEVRTIDMKAGTISFRRRVSGHTSEIGSISLTPDGKYALSTATKAYGAESPQIALFWRTSDGAVISKVGGIKGPVLRSQIHPDGRFATLVQSDSLSIVDLKRDLVVRTQSVNVGYGSNASSVLLSRDGQHIFVNDGSSILDTEGNRTKLPLSVRYDRTLVAFSSSDPQRLFVEEKVGSGDDFELLEFSVAGVLLGKRGTITRSTRSNMAVLPDNKHYVIFGGRDSPGTSELQVYRMQAE